MTHDNEVRALEALQRIAVALEKIEGYLGGDATAVVDLVARTRETVGLPGNGVEKQTE